MLPKCLILKYLCLLGLSDEHILVIEKTWISAACTYNASHYKCDAFDYNSDSEIVTNSEVMKNIISVAA